VSTAGAQAALGGTIPAFLSAPVKKFSGGKETVEEAALDGTLALLSACGRDLPEILLLGSAHPLEFGGVGGADLAERTARALRGRGIAIPVEFYAREGVYVRAASLSASANGADLVHEAALRVARGERRSVGVLALEQMRLKETPEITTILRSLIHEDERRYGLTMPALGALLQAYAEARTPGLDRALRAIVIQNRRNASANPRAHIRKAFSLDDYESDKNPLVSEPLRLWGVAPTSSGYAGIRVGCDRPARRAVRIVGIGQGIDCVAVAARARFLRSDATRSAMDALARTARRAPEEIGCGVAYAEIHDAFPIIEYQGLLDTGLLAEATAVNEILAGAIAPEGRIPVNLSGGVMGGHPVGATGVGQIVELALQGLGVAEMQRAWPAPHESIALNVGGPATYNCVTLLRTSDDAGAEPEALIDLPSRIDRRDFDLATSNGPLASPDGRVVSRTRLFYPPAGHASPLDVVFVELPDRRVFAIPQEPSIALGETVTVTRDEGLFHARRSIDGLRRIA